MLRAGKLDALGARHAAGARLRYERYHQESFGAPCEREEDIIVPLDVVPSEIAGASISFSLAGKTVVCTQADTVLKLAKSAGLTLPSGCNFGLCGTCKINKTAGEVQIVHNGGISEDDIAAG